MYSERKEADMHIRLSEELKEELKQEAKEEGRTLSEQVIFILKKRKKVK